MLSSAAFDALVGEALEGIPERLMRLLDNVAVLVEDRDPDEPTLLGVYIGVALTERDHDYTFVLPDRIVVFRAALMDICQTEDELREQVAITVVHEIAHHFGLDDHELHELGWG